MEDYVCNDVHSTLRSHRTQMGTIGLPRLAASTSQPARSLACRTVLAKPVERSRLPSSPFSFTQTVPASCSSSASFFSSHGDDVGHCSDPPPPRDLDGESDASGSRDFTGAAHCSPSTGSPSTSGAWAASWPVNQRATTRAGGPYFCRIKAAAQDAEARGRHGRQRHDGSSR